jgi:sirohydrochlorin ferrochelatase
MIQIFKWTFSIASAFLFGVFYVSFLTVHPVKMSLRLLAAALAFFTLVASLLLAFAGWELLVAIPLAFASSIAGYALMSRIVLSRQDPRSIPRLQREENEIGLGHTAVIYFTHGEPETYSPIGWINQFREFDEQGIAFVPFLARPFFLHGLRKSYLKVGKSDHRRMHQQMLNSLERAYRAEGDNTTRFYLSFLDDDPRPDAAVVQALNEGASRIIVAEVFLTISNHTAEGKALIEHLNLEGLGVPIFYSGPLYNSKTLQRMFVQRANAHIGNTDKSRVGILLVGHGQPAQWDEKWPTETEQELGFRKDILELLEGDGYDHDNLALAWMEFRQPKPAVKIEEFSGNGVEKVLYFSAAISADAIHSQHDVPALVNQARVPVGFPLINLGAWNNDPLVIQAIKEKIDAQMESDRTKPAQSPHGSSDRRLTS